MILGWYIGYFVVYLEVMGIIFGLNQLKGFQVKVSWLFRNEMISWVVIVVNKQIVYINDIYLLGQG